jgi:hypothetical protein
VIRPFGKEMITMSRWHGAGSGFESRFARVASARLTNTVAASLAIGAFAVILTVAFAVMSTKVAMAMPVPT